MTIGEGADVYGSDGEQWGRVDAVGAKYLTIVEGLLGQREYYLPVSLVASGDDERVELTVPLEEAKAQALTEEPTDEPIYTDSEKIPEQEMETAAVPTPAPRIATDLNDGALRPCCTPRTAVLSSELRRGVAQSGSAHGWGPCGRRFESCLPDHLPLRTK